MAEPKKKAPGKCIQHVRYEIVEVHDRKRMWIGYTMGSYITLSGAKSALRSFEKKGMRDPFGNKMDVSNFGILKREIKYFLME